MVDFVAFKSEELKFAEQRLNGVTVSGICDINDICPPNSSVRRMNITFKRPNPDANILFNTNGNGQAGLLQQTGKVKLTSPKGKILTVTITSTGQVSVQ